MAVQEIGLSSQPVFFVNNFKIYLYKIYQLVFFISELYRACICQVTNVFGSALIICQTDDVLYSSYPQDDDMNTLE